MAGREFVSLSFQAAARNSPFSMSLMKLGISIETGQPRTHWGLAQSRQRWASAWAISAVRPLLTSPKSRFLSSAGRSGIFWRRRFIRSLAGTDLRISFRQSCSNSARSFSLSSGASSFLSSAMASFP